MMKEGNVSPGLRLDYQQTAILETSPSFPPKPSYMPNGGRIDVLRWNPEHISMQVESDAAGVIVLSEMVYPGWQARMDGKPIPILRANYLLRGLSLPEGTHRVELIYRPRTLVLGLVISGLTLLMVTVGIFRLWPCRFRNS